jgi:sialate O-acetylesterase
VSALSVGRPAIALALLLLAQHLWADPKLPAIFADRMVVQREQEIRIWGTADPGEAISVRLSKDASTTKAAPDGTWSISLAPLSAGGPFELMIAGKTTVVFHDLMVGEVWLASGQSNMAFPLRAAADGSSATEHANDPAIRFFTVPRNGAERGEWRICSPDTAATFSAVAFFFAQNLHDHLGVPIGIIVSAYPGTIIEQWSAPSGPNANEVKPKEEAAGSNGETSTTAIPPSFLFKTMIEPLFPFSLRGVLWYQGETNVTRAYKYEGQLKKLIADWRKGFKNESLRVLLVQLPSYGAPVPQPRDSAWAELRDAQLRVARDIPNVGLAVTIDLGDGGNLHPPRKHEVGDRLAGLALGLVYQRAGVFSSPIYLSAEISGARVIVHFSKNTGALRAQGGAVLTGFALAGADRKFYSASASIQGDDIVVTSPQVSAPVAVRYAWANNPACNLVNEAGLPAAPFRSDDWPGITARRAQALRQ